jgi:hypothetical protein
MRCFWLIVATAVVVATAARAEMSDQELLASQQEYLRAHAPAPDTRGKGPEMSDQELLASQQEYLRAREMNRASYRAGLERAFLENGVSADVFIETKANPLMMDFKRYPKLVIFTYLSKATVYQFITKGRVLEGARHSGFQMVDFMDKGGKGHWFYDLTAAGTCDVNGRLCY